MLLIKEALGLMQKFLGEILWLWRQSDYVITMVPSGLNICKSILQLEEATILFLSM